MARIVCAHFDETLKADAAVRSLMEAGFPRAEIDSFYNPPPGQHATYPLGGDVGADSGTRRAGPGAALGAAIGAALGAVLAFLAVRAGVMPGAGWSAVSVVFGAGIGAYIGSFIGGVAVMKRGAPPSVKPRHGMDAPAGRMIATLITRPEQEARAIDVLRTSGARHLWRAEGTWRNGSWLDYDPRAPLAAI
jgi:hypothetical protein